jgi:hypothetical protein
VLLALPDRIELFSRDDLGRLARVELAEGWLVGKHIAARLDTRNLVLARPDRSQAQHVVWP